MIRLRPASIEDYALPGKTDELRRVVRLRLVSSWFIMALAAAMLLIAYTINANTQDMLEIIEQLPQSNAGTASAQDLLI